MNIFFLFEEEYERSDVESIWDIRIPIEEIKKYLEENYSAIYRSNLWIYTQLRRYEEELGVRLFRKDSAGRKDGSFCLSICDRMLRFYQKQHLHVSKKLKVANAVYDKIINDSAVKKNRPIKILLGAGSTIFHLANILAERSWQDPLKYSIYTHNLGSLKRLVEPSVNYNNIEVFTPTGRVDPVTYTIIGQTNELYESTSFDYIVMGTSWVLDGKLFNESSEEAVIKSAVLKRARGEKILLLTKHEFTDQKLPGLTPYGSLLDYDFVVVPRLNKRPEFKKKYDIIFDGYQDLFTPEIIHWNYPILKIRKDQ